MYDELQQNDARQFDRLIDRELSSDERRQFLLSLDGRPDGWRQCALAFLEAQALGSDLKHLVRPTASTPIATADPKAGASGRRRSQPKAVQWLAIAAGLLIAFGLGVLSSERSGGPTLVEVVPTPDVHSPSVVAATSPDAAATANSPRDSLVLFVRDDDGGAKEVRVPLVDAHTLDRQLGVQFRSGVPDAVRDELRQNGYSIHSQRRYAPLWLENGGSLVVPVEDTRIVPVSPDVY